MRQSVNAVRLDAPTTSWPGDLLLPILIGLRIRPIGRYFCRWLNQGTIMDLQRVENRSSHSRTLASISKARLAAAFPRAITFALARKRG
jgi:hypothetical protein